MMSDFLKLINDNILHVIARLVHSQVSLRQFSSQANVLLVFDVLSFLHFEAIHVKRVF